VTGALALEDFRRDYRVVIADPPFNFKSNSVAKPGRNARRHYTCMSLAEIGALPVKDHLAADAVLFLWVPGPFLAIGAHLPLMKAWGFEPSGMGFVWIKLNPNAPPLFFCEHDLAMGGGFTTRKNAEYCLIGKRGKCPAIRVCSRGHHRAAPRTLAQAGKILRTRSTILGRPAHRVVRPPVATGI
jgi:N6-adenosine-specific RNA methylase IME4